MTKDDRTQFENSKLVNIDDLGEDKEIFTQSKEMIKSLDKYNYSYLWNWLGLPIIQWPADIMATQEVLWRVKPDVVIETGVARGGSVIFIASILKMMGKGKVIGVDIDIRSHNKYAIMNHPMADLIKLIEGPSTCEDVLRQVSNDIKEEDKVMVILDSDHSYDHVLSECNEYSKFVSKGSYLVVADTFVGHLTQEEAPKNRSKLWFKGNEPLTARDEFLKNNPNFIIDTHTNNKLVLSSSPGGYLKCIR